MAITLKSQVAELTAKLEEITKNLDAAVAENVQLKTELHELKAAKPDAGDTRIGKRRGRVCPVSGKPTIGRRVFAGPGRDAMAKRAINLLLADLTDEAERYMKEEGFADPDRIRKAAELAKAKGTEEIVQPSPYLRD